MSTSKDIAFWACIVISNIWGSSSRSIWNMVPWIVMALAIRGPYWVSALKGKPSTEQGGKL